MRTIITLLAALVAVLLTACSTEAPQPAATPGTNETALHGPLENWQPEGDPEPVLFTGFEQPYTYQDGIEFRIVKAEGGQLTAAEAERENYGDVYDFKAGDPKVEVTWSIKNGSDEVFDAATNVEVAYGPEGESPQQFSSSDGKSVHNVRPGRTETETGVYNIPKKFWGDVEIQVHPNDWNEKVRPQLIYTGSVT